MTKTSSMIEHTIKALKNKAIVHQGECYLPYFDKQKGWYINLDREEQMLHLLDDFKIIARPDAFLTLEDYQNWAKENGFELDAWCSRPLSKLVVKHAFVRANWWCNFTGGYVEITYYDNTTLPEKNKKYFSNYGIRMNDMDDLSFGADLATKEEADLIWEHLITFPDLTVDELSEIGMVY